MRTHGINEPLPGAPTAYLANGLVGLRVPPIPLPRGSALVNGFVGLSPEKATEELAEAPYPVGADIEVNRVWLSDAVHQAVFRSQAHDFSCGELRSRFDFEAGGATASVEVLTVCSRTQPTLTLQEVAVTVDRACALTLRAHLDPRGLEGRLAYRCMPGRHQDAILRWESRGGLSSLGASYVSEFVGDGLQGRRRNDYGYEADLAATHYAIEAEPGRRYVLRQMASLVPSVMHAEPHWQASRLVGLGTWHGFDKLRADNRAAWAELWKGRPLLGGAGDRWQDIADAAFFYLHSSVSSATPCGVAPFGLSRRCEYSGHVFWDWETFMFPPVLLTAPEAARATMEYRARLLPMARFNARLNGYRGVQFPWQSANVGCEVTPFYAGAAGGAVEQHINLDVAFAMAQFVHATGDDLFLRQTAWPVLQGVAEWIESRVERTARGYEIRHVTGIDEGRDNVHNDSETNGLAAVVLGEAAAFARRLGGEPPPAWTAIAEGMFYPLDPATGAVLQHEAFEYKGGIYCPTTMMLYFPFGWNHSPAVDAATYAANLKLIPTYLGMPMMGANCAVWAARAGRRDLALEFFEKGCGAKMVEPFAQHVECTMGEFSGGNKTLFLTDLGGFLNAVLLGLTGLQLGPGDPASWARHSVVLPEGWEAVQVERLWARGRPWRLSAPHGATRATLHPCD